MSNVKCQMSNTCTDACTRKYGYGGGAIDENTSKNLVRRYVELRQVTSTNFPTRVGEKNLHFHKNDIEINFLVFFFFFSGFVFQYLFRVAIIFESKVTKRVALKCPAVYGYTAFTGKYNYIPRVPIRVR